MFLSFSAPSLIVNGVPIRFVRLMGNRSVRWFFRLVCYMRVTKCIRRSTSPFGTKNVLGIGNQCNPIYAFGGFFEFCLQKGRLSRKFSAYGSASMEIAYGISLVTLNYRNVNAFFSLGVPRNGNSNSFTFFCFGIMTYNAKGRVNRVLNYKG